MKTYKVYETLPNAAPANARANKSYYDVHKFDGDRKFAHLFARETMVEFREAANEGSWSERRKFTEMYRNILFGDAKNLWEQACEMGNGEDDPINPDAPQADDHEQVVTNFFGEVAGQEFPGNIQWDYLRNLTYDWVVETFGDDPVQYYREIRRIETMTENELGQRDNTEPSEDSRRDYFLRSFNEADIQWLEEVDLGGTNDPTTMSRLEIAKRMKARTANRVSAASRRLANKKDDDDNGNDKGNRDNKRKRGRGKDRGNGKGNDNNKKGKLSDQKCPFHGGHTWFECRGNPHPKNKNFDKATCRNILGRDDIQDFPWFLSSCKKNRNLSVEDGKKKGGQRNQQKSQQPQQTQQHQQYHFAPPQGMPPLPLGTTIIPPPGPPFVQQGTSFAFGSNSYQQQPAAVVGSNSYQQQSAAGSAPTQQAAGGGRWVPMSGGGYRLV